MLRKLTQEPRELVCSNTSSFSGQVCSATAAFQEFLTRDGANCTAYSDVSGDDSISYWEWEIGRAPMCCCGRIILPRIVSSASVSGSPLALGIMILFCDQHGEVFL